MGDKSRTKWGGPARPNTAGSCSETLCDGLHSPYSDFELSISSSSIARNEITVVIDSSESSTPKGAVEEVCGVALSKANRSSVRLLPQRQGLSFHPRPDPLCRYRG